MLQAAERAERTAQQLEHVASDKKALETQVSWTSLDAAAGLLLLCAEQ